MVAYAEVCTYHFYAYLTMYIYLGFFSGSNCNFALPYWPEEFSSNVILSKQTKKNVIHLRLELSVWQLQDEMEKNDKKLQ